jgi:predicted N-formylglutamate amidohydrolase
VAIHSFMPVYRGYVRPWDIGIIIGDKSGLAEKLIAGLEAEPSLTVGVNEPYSTDDNVYHTLERHGVANNLPTAMVEVRQDHIAHAAGPAEWAARLSAILRDCLAGSAR